MVGGTPGVERALGLLAPSDRAEPTSAPTEVATSHAAGAAGPGRRRLHGRRGPRGLCCHATGHANDTRDDAGAGGAGAAQGVPPRGARRQAGRSLRGAAAHRLPPARPAVQAMQGMPMQMVMGPMGPMMAGPMPHGMMAPGMAAPQLTQMLVDAARGGRSSNVFFKTRICNK